eukprot:SAG22_NODE_12472_length_441_cov_1.444444_2_plen_82_part_01
MPPATEPIVAIIQSTKMFGTAKGGAQKLGTAVSHGVDAGVRLMSNVGAVAHKVASKVSSVAGTVGDVAAMAAPALTALGPGV